jgi:hypothetical protein
MTASSIGSPSRHLVAGVAGRLGRLVSRWVGWLVVGGVGQRFGEANGLDRIHSICAIYHSLTLPGRRERDGAAGGLAGREVHEARLVRDVWVVWVGGWMVG